MLGLRNGTAKLELLLPAAESSVKARQVISTVARAGRMNAPERGIWRAAGEPTNAGKRTERVLTRMLGGMLGRFTSNAGWLFSFTLACRTSRLRELAWSKKVALPKPKLVKNPILRAIGGNAPQAMDTCRVPEPGGPENPAEPHGVAMLRTADIACGPVGDTLADWPIREPSGLMSRVQRHAWALEFDLDELLADPSAIFKSWHFARRPAEGLRIFDHHRDDTAGVAPTIAQCPWWSHAC